MADLIEIPIIYNGREMMIHAELLNRGYIHGFQIVINEIPVLCIVCRLKIDLSMF